MKLDPADLLVPFAYDENGAEVRPPQGVHGAQYACPGCGANIVFYKGDQVQWHFAHLVVPDFCEFVHERETEEHLRAKEEIVKAIEGRRDVKIVRTCGKCGTSYEQPMPPRRGLRAVKECTLKLGDGFIRPDVAAVDEYDNLVAVFEVYATHRVDEEKRRALENIPWAEFEASEILESDKWRPLPPVDHFGSVVFGPEVCPACAARRETIRGFFVPGGPLAQQIGDDYEERPEQTKMALAVDDALDNALDKKGIALIEAGTGTGKTLAYLLPAALHPGRTVISTHTRNLQDQIATKDVPNLASALGQPLQMIVMKGMNNYLCRRRLAAYCRSALVSQKDSRLWLLDDWANKTETGDRAEIEWMPDDDPLWSEVRSDADVRLGSDCPFFESCFVTRLRRRAEQARLVIVNHHLFFADLAIPAAASSRVLPKWDAVIFDEAHDLEDAAAHFSGVRLSSRRVKMLRTDIERSQQLKLDSSDGKRTNTKTRETTLDMMDKASGYLARLADLLAGLVAGREGKNAAGRRAELGTAVKTDEAVERYSEADSSFDRLEQQLRTLGIGDVELTKLAARCRRLRADLAGVMKDDDKEYATWVKLPRGEPGRPIQDVDVVHGSAVAGKGLGGSDSKAQFPPDVVLGRTPLNIAQILKEKLFDRGRPVVFTSATLADHRGFGFVRGRLGITGDAKELRLPSPFKFEQQALLYVPKEMPEPSDEKAFLPALLQQTRELLRITGGGALLLYTSFRNQRWMADHLRREGWDELLVQGEAPRNLLLERLREEQNAVLLATASFWQGVDVVGEALRLVVIDKLPFDVPTDPLVKAHIDRLKREGRNWFKDYLIPRASLALRQGVGRLIRSLRDRGIVAVLDSRFYSYEGAFPAALPRCAEARDLAAVEAWWKANSHAPSTGPTRRP